jgi:hypothetical protein
MTQTAAPRFSAITSKLGVYVDTTTHASQRTAEMAARRAIKSGAADSAAVWTQGNAISYFGSGR